MRAVVMSTLILLSAIALSGQETGQTTEEREPLRLRLPVPGSRGVDWAISKYVDLDPGAGVRDYRGGALSRVFVVSARARRDTGRAKVGHGSGPNRSTPIRVRA